MLQNTRTSNTRAEKASGKMKNSSSGWILKKSMFQKLIHALRPGNVNLFASRLCQQIPRYISHGNKITRSNFYSLISKSFDRSKPEPTLIVSELNIGLGGMKGLRRKYSAEALSHQTVDLVEKSQTFINFFSEGLE